MKPTGTDLMYFAQYRTVHYYLRTFELWVFRFLMALGDLQKKYKTPRFWIMLEREFKVNHLFFKFKKKLFFPKYNFSSCTFPKDKGIYSDRCRFRKMSLWDKHQNT